MPTLPGTDPRALVNVLAEGSAPMRVIYVAGPITAATAWKRELHNRAAEEASLVVWKLGAVPVCPHTMARHFDGELPKQAWLKGDLELLRRCDAILLVGEWEASDGTVGEVSEASKRGMPILTSTADLASWLQREACRVPREYIGTEEPKSVPPTHMPSHGVRMDGKRDDK